MKNKKIMSLGLFAMLSLSFLSLSLNQMAYAQSDPSLAVKITDFQEDIIAVAFQNNTIEEDTFIWALTVNGTQGSTANNWLYQINPDTFEVDNKYNATSVKGHSARDLECSNVACYVISSSGAVATEDHVSVILANGARTTYDYFGLLWAMDVRQTVVGDFTAVNLMIFNQTASNGHRITFQNPFNGAISESTDGLTESISATIPRNFDIIDVSSDDDNPDTQRDIPVTWSTGSVARLENYRFASNTFETVATTGQGGTEDYGSNLCVDKENYHENSIVWATGVGNDEIGNILAYDTSGATTLTYRLEQADLGLGNNIMMSCLAMPDRDLFAVQSSGAGSTIGFYNYTASTGAVDTSDPVFVSIIPVTTQQGNTNGKMVYVPSLNIILVPENNNGQALNIIELADIGPGEEVTGIDCSLPANQNILICRLTETTGGNIGGLGGIIDTGLFSLFTNSGIIDGDNTDPQTNGIGYFITITGFGVMTAMFFIATKGRLNEVPTFVWMISAIALLGAITAIGWLEPTFLIIGIIAIVALSAMQIRNSIDRGIDFGGRGDF